MGRTCLASLLGSVALIGAGALASAAQADTASLTLMQAQAPFQAGNLNLKIKPRGDLLETMQNASRRATRVLGHDVLFDAPHIGAQSVSMVADVAASTAQAFEDSALVLNGREKTISIRKVLFVEADRPDARLEGDVLKISIAFQLGSAGRPSAERIFHVLATQATI